MEENQENPAPELREIPGVGMDMDPAPADDTAAGPIADAVLVRAAMTGDDDAFTMLYRASYRTVCRIVRQYVWNEDAAFDAIQETYLHAYAGLPRLQAPEAFFSWLRQIARNCARTQAAADGRRNRATIAVEDGWEERLQEEAPDRETAMDISAVLRAMPEEQARLLVMVYYDGLRITEIAKLQQQPRTTVQSRFRAAQKQLKQLLAAKGIDRRAYGGSLLTMLAVSLRDAVGTDLLSAAVAQEILDAVLSGKPSRHKENLVVERLARQQRTAAVLRLSALLIALTVATSCLTGFWLYTQLPAPAVGPGTAVSSQEPSKTAPPAEGESGLGSTAASTSAETGTTAGAPASDVPPGGTTAAAASKPTASVPATTETTMSPPSSESTTAITAAPSSTHSTSVPTAVPEIFVPDYRPGKANRSMQNQTGRFTYTAIPGNNFMHEEHFDRQDDWVYVFFRTHQGYKFRFDGKGSPIPLPADIGAENAPVVMGDWIYYLRDGGIRRVRTDGSGAEPFVADAAFFCMDSQTLYYSTEQPVGPYGRQTWQLTVRARSLTGGEDRLLFQDEHAQQVDTRFLLLGDWLYFPGHAYSLDGRHYAFPLTDGYGGQYWIDGSRVYVNDELRQLSWLDFSGTVPVYTRYADLRYAEGIADFRCEFLDFEQNRMAVTIQENNFQYFRWMNWDGSVIGDRPQPLQQTRMGHRFHRFEDGWIFAADNDDVPYRCRADGSGYRLYSAL